MEASQTLSGLVEIAESMQRHAAAVQEAHRLFLNNRQGAMGQLEEIVSVLKGLSVTLRPPVDSA